VINYRLQGLAEKKPETQGTVLVKRIKLGIRSVEERGWIGSKESNRSRGFSRRFTRHKRTEQDYKVSRGARCKKAESSPTSGQR
jgi:hypothetical protein